MKTKVYITDEGFGPIVRQSAILEELQAIIPELQVVLQLERHYNESQNIIPNASYIKKFNNIVWQKKDDGTPDSDAIKAYYQDYNNLADSFIASETDTDTYDFIISDFVYEAFELANKHRLPSFGVAHFTWDWFFSKFYPPVIEKPVIDKMMERANLADILFFPTFTPQEIIKHYGAKVYQVPLVVRRHNKIINREKGTNRKVLFIDSGSGVNKIAMDSIVKKLPTIKDITFYLPESFNIQAENIVLVPRNELLVDYIADMDLVVGRAGFNTISECIAYRTPMLLFGENLNPEMRENSMLIKEQSLGSFVSLSSLINSPKKVLEDFWEGEYSIIRRNMAEHNHRIDGAKVIAEIIADKLSIK